MCVFAVANGFCDYNQIDSADNRGKYNWNETTVGQQLQRNCVYNNMSVATRRCGGHLLWDMYDGNSCITRDTFELMQLAERIKNVRDQVISNSPFVKGR